MKRKGLRDASIAALFVTAAGCDLGCTRGAVPRVGRLIAIERNEALFNLLRRACRDPRLRLYNDCAGNILDIVRRCDAGQADCVLSGIPFSFLPVKARVELLKNTHRILKRGGQFIAYQTFYQPPGHLRAPLQELFRVVKTEYAILSVPPLLLLEATK